MPTHNNNNNRKKNLHKIIVIWILLCEVNAAKSVWFGNWKWGGVLLYLLLMNFKMTRVSEARIFLKYF